jgi:AcrR family transcriptional regulator
MSVELTASRRERQKQVTRQALHEAAFTLAEESGLSGATVEAIAGRADVATRTFFNYFASKEDAVLDCDPARPPHESLR